MKPHQHHEVKAVWISACCPLQVKTDIIVESRHQTIQGLAFPLKETAKKALQQLAQKRINYIQLVSRRGREAAAAFAK